MKKINEDGPPKSTGFWTIVFGQHASDDMVINLDTKSFRDDQGDPRAAEAPIAAFELNNGANERLGWTFRPRFRSLLWGEQPTIFASRQALMKFQQCRSRMLVATLAMRPGRRKSDQEKVDGFI
ncbi:MAG: hypothetical protein GY792_38130 [Gammaproteobacteria bacterium]|nr:hypothetical protein [Gammaproteobacteria bacterium]